MAKCEGCKKPAHYQDSEGIDLCADCFYDLVICDYKLKIDKLEKKIRALRRKLKGL